MAGNSFKLLVVDVDGTLVGREGTVADEDREALVRANDAGIMVSLGTGRAFQSCAEVLDLLSLDGYHLFCDGALVYSPTRREEVYAETLDRVVVRRAIEFARRNEINIDFYSTTRYFVERETWSAAVHRDLFDISPTIADFDTLCEEERIIKAGLVAASPGERAKARRFHREFGDSLYFSWVTSPTCPGVDFVNVVAPGVSKGKALQALISHLGITPAEVIAIGDGNNDLSLLSVAGLGVAMGNATDEAKAVADYVTLDVEQGGVAAAVHRFLL